MLPESSWLAVIRDFGVFGGLVVFFVWTTWQRSLATEKFVRDTLVELIVSSNSILQQNTEAMQQNTQAMAKMSEAIEYCRAHNSHGGGNNGE